MCVYYLDKRNKYQTDLAYTRTEIYSEHTAMSCRSEEPNSSKSEEWSRIKDWSAHWGQEDLGIHIPVSSSVSLPTWLPVLPAPYGTKWLPLNSSCTALLFFLKCGQWSWEPQAQVQLLRPEGQLNKGCLAQDSQFCWTVKWLSTSPGKWLAQVTSLFS